MSAVAGQKLTASGNSVDHGISFHAAGRASRFFSLYGKQNTRLCIFLHQSCCCNPNDTVVPAFSIQNNQSFPQDLRMLSNLPVNLRIDCIHQLFAVFVERVKLCRQLERLGKTVGQQQFHRQICLSQSSSGIDAGCNSKCK